MANYYSTKLIASGNGELNFSLADNSNLPKGLLLYPDGTIKGVPVEAGNYSFKLGVKDEDDEQSIHQFTLHIEPKNNTDVLITNAVTKNGTAYRTSIMQLNESPFFNNKDSVLTTDIEEINFSDINKYNGLEFIQTDVNDADKNDNDFLSFNIDEDATIYIAYERLDNKFTSTIPVWLNDYKKEDGQITAQYRYFDVYSKHFSKGKVVFPAADAKTNKVGSNYFIIIQKSK